MLGTLITSKTRLRLLVKFFVNAANRGHMRGLAGEFNESTNSIRKELNNLSEAGYLHKRVEGKRIDYRANVDHPLFAPLQAIVRKYLGLDAIVEHILERMGDVREVWLIGDYAEGNDSGRIEVIVLGGENLNVDYGQRLAEKLEEMIGREVEIHFGNPGDAVEEPRLLLFEGGENRE